MIEAHHLSKRYGETLAVDDLSFTAAAGQVTGFLGPNGSGKSTTMRMLVGLDAPSAGAITVDGRSYRKLRFPLRAVGALFDANAAHPGRAQSSVTGITPDSRLIGKATPGPATSVELRAPRHDRDHHETPLEGLLDNKEEFDLGQAMFASAGQGSSGRWPWRDGSDR